WGHAVQTASCGSHSAGIAKVIALVYRKLVGSAICPAVAFGHEITLDNSSKQLELLGITAAQSARMTKLLKSVLIAGTLITSTAVVSFADDAPKAADKAPSAGSGSATKSTKSTSTKSTTKSTSTKSSGSKSGSGSK